MWEMRMFGTDVYHLVAAKKALDFAGRGGCAVFMSMYPKDYEMRINLLEYCYRKELRIQGMYLAPSLWPSAA